MRKLKCPSCGKSLEVPSAFSGVLTCPECQARIFDSQRVSARLCPLCSEPLLAGSSRCCKCGASVEEGPSQAQAPEPAFIRVGPAPHLAGCLVGCVVAAAGFYFGGWAGFLAPVGLLAVLISAFAGSACHCSSCGSKLLRADLSVCPVCKSRFGGASGEL